MRILSKILLAASLLFAACEEDTIEPDLFGSLTGTVIDDATGLPVPNASVTTNPASTTLSTDVAGKFDVGEIKTGTYAVRAEKTGYALAVESVLVSEDQATTVEIRLFRDSLNNDLPLPPAYVSPTNGAVNQSVTLNFKWRSTDDPDLGEEVRYTLLLFASGTGQADTVVHKTADTTATAVNLQYGTEYFWQVLAYDEATDAPVFGAVWRFETVAPPDNRILFARKTDGKYDIWSTNPAGTSQVQLTSGGSNNWRPRARPDRKRIAFLSDQNIVAQLFTMNPDGSDIRQVTTLPVAGFNTIDLDFCWSPDGARLLYMNNSRLFTINADGTGLAIFADAPAGFTFSEVDWNGHTKTISARLTGGQVYESRIVQYSEAGAVLATLVADAPGGLGGGQFFPDGSRIVYVQDDAGFDSPDGRQLDARLKVRNLATGVVADFSANKVPGTNDLDPRWSPDGSKVIFTNTNNDGVSPRSLWTADGTPFASGRVKILDNAEMPDWR